MATIIDAIIRLRDQFTPTLSHVRQQLSETERVSQRAARDVGRFGRSISGIGEAMLPAAAGVVGGIGYATKSFADFDYVITGAAAKAQATTEEMAAMSNEALRIGATYPISARNAAEALDTLAAGGLNATQAVATLEAVTRASVASGEDMALTANAITSSMSMWGQITDDLDSVQKASADTADIIQQAANKSKLGINDFSVALSYIGPVAAGVGDSLEDVSAMMSVLSNKGIENTTIGTSLRTAYSRIKIDPDTIDQLEAMGAKMHDNEGKVKPMLDMFLELQKITSSMGEEEATAFINGLVGQNAFSGVMAFLNTAPEEILKMREAMYNAAGSSQEAANLMAQSFMGQIKGMESALEAILLKIGKAAGPMIAPFVNAVKQFADRLNEMPEERIQAIIRLAMGFVGLTGGFLVIGKAISLFGSLAGFLNPIGVALANGTTLTGLFAGRIASLTTSLRTVRNTGILVFNGIGSGIRGTITTALAPFGRSLSTMVTAPLSLLGSSMSAFWARISTPGTSLGSAFGAAFNVIRTRAAEAASSVSTSFGRMVTRTVNRFYILRNNIVSVFSGILGRVSGFATSMTGFINTIRTQGARQAFSNLVLSISRGLNVLRLAFATNPVGLALLAIGAAAIIVANNWDLFKNVAEVVWNKISYIVGQVVNTLKATFGNLATSARVHFGRLTELWNKVTGDSHTSGELITKVINTLGSVFTAGFGLIAGVVELAFAQIGTIINAFMGVGEGVITFLTGVFTGNWGMAWDGIKRIVMSVVGGIIETVENMVATIEDAVARIRGMEGTAMKNLQTRRQIEQTKELRDQAVSSGKVSKGSIEAFDKQNAGQNPGEEAIGTDFWRGGLTWVHEQGPEIIDLPNGTRVIPHSSSLKEEFNRGFSQGTNLISQAAAEMPEQFTGNWSAAWEGIKTIFTGIFDTITGIFDNFINAVSSALDRIMGKADTASERAAKVQVSADNVRRFDNQNAGQNPGENAIGTDFWRGGLTWVHEQGPEIIDLPNGTRVIPHSSSLKEEFNRGFSQGTNLISQAAAEMPEQTRAFIAGGAAGVPIENSVGGSSDITPMKEPERDGLGNLSGVDVPEYNIITPEDSISVRRSKMAAQEKQLREQDASGEVAAPGIPADGGGNVERDALGNIQGANIPEYNIIRPEDSISVRRSKQIAQERQVFAATAEETGNATSDTRAAESTGRPESNLQEAISTGRPSSNVQEARPTGNPSSNVQEARPTGNPSSNVKERIEPPKASPNITVQIPKLADQIIVREKQDIDNIVNQLVYRFQAHAMNRVVHAVR